MSKKKKPGKKKPAKKKKTTVKPRSAPTTGKRTKTDAPGSNRSGARRVFSIGGKVVLAVLAVWGVLVTTCVAVTPRVFVYPSVALDPANPVFTPFVVRNQGYLSIYDVKVSCAIKDIEFDTGMHFTGGPDYKSRLQGSRHVASVIRAGEDYAEFLPLTGLKLSPIKNGDIAIVVTFRPIKWLPCRRQRLHRFVVQAGKDGQRHWLPQPVDK